MTTEAAISEAIEAPTAVYEFEALEDLLLRLGAGISQPYSKGMSFKTDDLREAQRLVDERSARQVGGPAVPPSANPAPAIARPPTDGRLVARVPIEIGTMTRGTIRVEPGETFLADPADAPAMLERGSADVAPPAPELSDVERMTSAEIQERLDVIEAVRRTRREALAESQAFAEVTRRDLADLEDRQERAGEDHRDEITKLEQRAGELERQIRARTTAYDREVADTAAAKTELELALPQVKHREAEHRIQAEYDQLGAQLLAARRRTATALAELSAGEQQERAIKRAYDELASRATHETGVQHRTIDVIVASFAGEMVAVERFAQHPLTLRAGIRLVRDPKDPHYWRLDDDTADANS